MKPLKLLIAGMILLFASAMQAQVSIDVNLGSAPPWAPRVQADVRYYYLPDIDAYYDLRTATFVFSYNGSWIHRRYLPNVYRNYNLYDGRKVVVRNYCGDSPYAYYKNRNWERNSWMAQRFERSDRRYDSFNDRYPRGNHDWRAKDDRREYNNDKGRGHGHDREQRRGWND